MKLWNPNMKGAVLSLRYTRDENGRPIQVQGDAEGVFDLPDRDAEFLKETSGWYLPKAPKSAKPIPVAVEAPKPEAPKEEAPEAKADSLPIDDPEDHSEVDDEGPDIDAIRTKVEAIAIADKWRGKGYDIPEFDDSMKLSEMKEYLVLGLYGDEDEEDDD